jgi:ADP-ribose pyrophosphatase YjhB (NUDIX family)
VVKHSSPKGRTRVRFLHLPQKIMATYHSAGGVILNEQGKVVVVRQIKNKLVPWSLPKGRVEEGEDYLTAAKREIHEESGLTHLELIKELPTYSRPILTAQGTDSVDTKVLHYYIFRTKEEHLKPVDADNPEAKWVTLSKLKELINIPQDREFISRVEKDLLSLRNASTIAGDSV